MNTIIVAGSRNFTNREVIFAVLDKVAKQLLDMDIVPPNSIRIIHNANRGVEALSTEWAISRLCDYDEYPPNWIRFKDEANNIAHTKMILEDPDILVAFPETDENLIKKAMFAQIKVIKVTSNETGL
ncbi:DUF2493 domain-containing protein [bacterium]|nr:DUF2493 domain-containing protein [bacterium]